MLKTILIIALCSWAGTAHAQLQWPQSTATTKPWARWWWQGSAVNRSGLSAAMQKYQEAGLGGLEITPIYGVKGHESEFIPFLSLQWMDILEYTLHEGKRLGLGIDLANATGWPFGGPWVTPENACKNVQVKTFELVAGETIKEPLRYQQQPFYRSESRAVVDINKLSYPIATNAHLQAFAFDQVRYPLTLKPSAVFGYGPGQQFVDLTKKVDSGGRLDWTPAAGRWQVLALFTGWHGKMVERAAPGGEGDVIDHFSEAALRHYLARFDKAFSGRDLTGLRAFFNDSYEVDDSRGQSNWTPGLLKEFRLRRGYDLAPYLPQLFGRDSSDTGRRILADYRQTISDLLLDHFTRPWQQWARNRNKLVRNQSHGSPANILDLYAAVDIPETEGADILRFKFASSTAHVTRKKLASAETATWLNEHFQSTLADVKQAADKYFAGGVNHLVWHGTNYSPADEPWPGWLFYAAVHFTPANSFWCDFSVLNNYVERCQRFLQLGVSDNDILVYFPFNDRLAEMGRDLLLHFDGMEGFERTDFKTSCEWLLKNGYTFDLISDKQILQITGNGAALRTGGHAYRTIIVPNAKYMPLQTLQKLKQLAAAGANIIFYKKVPGSVPGLANLANNNASFKKIWQNVGFVEDSAVHYQRANISKGHFLLGDALPQLLTAASIARETMADRQLQFARRRYRQGHVYFISNTANTMLTEWVPLRVGREHVALFNPMTGAHGLVKTKKENGEYFAWLQLAPGESSILQTLPAALNEKRYSYFAPAEQVEQLTNPWQLRFLSGGPTLPRARELAALKPWTALGDSELNTFSGTASYTTHFSKPAFEYANYQLNLGNVQESADVLLNGVLLARLLGPDFSVTIPAGKLKADNTLEVIVTNGMANRIAELDKHGVYWKKFYNTNFPARLPQNRGADGLFTAAGWANKTAGLVGPVSIRALKLVE